MNDLFQWIKPVVFVCCNNKGGVKYEHIFQAIAEI